MGVGYTKKIRLFRALTLNKKRNMKTNEIYSVQQARRSFLHIIAAAALALALSNPARAQKGIRMSIGADTYIAGNLLGTLYSPYISISKGRSSLFGGPVIQKRSSKTGGMRFGGTFNITGAESEGLDCEGDDVDGILSLNAFGFVQYTKGFSLSYRNQQVEERGSLIKDYDWNNYQASTAEFCGGIELLVRISRHITWKNYAGFDVCDQRNYKQGMWNDKSTVGLVLGTGLCIKPLN